VLEEPQIEVTLITAIPRKLFIPIYG
jgi:hypothetical protein